MQNKFGLKDFVLLLVVVVIGLMVFANLWQEDRRFSDVRDIAQKVNSLEQRLARVQTSLESGAVAMPVAGGDGRTGSVTPARGGTPAAGNATSEAPWARPGVEVRWWPVPSFQNDPRNAADFAVGGTFTEIFESQPPTITPFRFADVYGRRINDIVTETLGRYNPESLKLEGVLAEAWQYDPNGMWARFKIRDNARFSDGAPITAEDVRWTYAEYMFNPQIEADRFRSVFIGSVKEVKVVSDKVVDFIYEKPLFSNLSLAVTLNIVPKHIFSQFTETQINQSTGLLVGSGPFKLERFAPDDQWKPGQDLVLVRNEEYWGAKPALASLRYTVIQDRLSALTAYTNGVGDMMRPTPKQFELQAEEPDFASKHDPLRWFNMRGGYSFIAWNGGKRGEKLTPFADKRVRLAMTHLIDRDRIRRDIDKNITRPATSPFSSETPQSNPDIKPWPYDLEKAKQLLTEAGWVDRNNDGLLDNERGDSFSWQLTFGQGSEGVLQMATYIKDQCALVGIKCELAPTDWAIFQDLLNKRDFDAITFAWSASAPESDPFQIWHSSQAAGQGDNFIQWMSPEADKLIDEGRATVDDAKRMQVWHKLHAVMHEEQPYTFMSETPWLRFVNKRIKNVHTYKSGIEQVEYYIPAQPTMMPN